MTPAEAAALLTVAAAFDNRKPDADQARAWAMALDGLRFEDCRDGIVAHYRASREWMMPSDVIGNVKKLRAVRITAYGPIEPPAHLDPDDTTAIHRHAVDARRAIADGEQVNHSPALEVLPLDREAAKARLRSIRAELARGGGGAPETTPSGVVSAAHGLSGTRVLPTAVRSDWNDPMTGDQV